MNADGAKWKTVASWNLTPYSLLDSNISEKPAASIFVTREAEERFESVATGNFP
jgi:hypothetical protein